MPEKTPGQVAYESLWLDLHGSNGIPWAYLMPHVQAAWDAAAQAVQDRVMQALLAGGVQAREERQARRDEDAC